MSDASHSDVEHRYSTVYERERSFARSVAGNLIEMRAVGVWHFMVPILFPLDYVRVRRARETFIVNFLFTKELSLEAARDVVVGRLDRKGARIRLSDETMRLIDTVENGLYSIDIQKRQVAEMECLTDHYIKLLSSQGETYQDLVRNAYREREAFLTFLDTLQEAERETGRAASRTLGHAGNRDFLDRMHELTERRRRREADRIFARSGGRSDAE